MSVWKGARARLRSLLAGGAAESRMEEEFAYHIEEATAQHIRAGMPAAAARRRALVEFGGAERYREHMRAGRGIGWLDDLRRDVHFALRALARRPGFAAVCIVTIALGVGATTALFSVANALLFRELPVASPAELFVVNERRDGQVSQGIEGMFLPYDRYESYVEATADVFTGLAAHRYAPFSVRAAGVASSASGVLVSGNYFAVLGTRPAAGRLIDSDVEPVVVVSYGYWQGRLGGDPAVVGQLVHIDGQPFTVAGVAPRGFGGTINMLMPDVWVPYRAYQAGRGEGWSGAWLALVGRLRPGLAAAPAEEMVAAAALRIPPESEQTRVFGAGLEAATGMPAAARGVTMGFFAMLIGTALLVLFIGSANIAGMLLARALSRRREVAVRLAIGAGRGRLIRQLLTESLCLFMLGGAAGVVIAYWATTLLPHLRFPVSEPVVIGGALDVRVLLLALLLTATTGVLFGLLPALRTARADLNSALRDGGSLGGTARSRGRQAFVAAQLAMAVVLLVTAGLFVRTLHEALRAEIGFDPAGVVVGGLNVAPLGYDETRGRLFYAQLLDELRAQPGVEVASRANVALLRGDEYGSTARSLTEEELVVPISYNTVEHGYFDALRIPLLAGRTFDDGDVRGGQRVALVNETLARQFWPGENPLGRQFRIGGANGPVYEVIGITRDGRYVTYTEQPQPFAFVSAEQQYSPSTVLHVRGRMPPAELLAVVRAQVAALDPDIALDNGAALSSAIGLTLVPQRLAATIVGALGALGLLLAGIGIYGVLAFQVAQRRREFGIRMALGAHSRHVLGLVLGRGALLALYGGMAGLVLAAGTAQLLKSLLPGISVLDPTTFTAVPIILGAVVLLACYLPARRAVRTEAAIALRSEG